MVEEREALKKIAWALWNRNLPSYETWEEIAGILHTVGIENPWLYDE